MSVKIVFILFLLSISLCENSFSQRTHVDSLMEEVNNKFTIDGNPIKPTVIAAFGPSPSDGPIITAVDLEMAHLSDLYYCDSCLGTHEIDYGADKDGRNLGNFSYQYLGKTTNNIHVVQTFSNGGGTFSLSSILFLSLHIRTTYLGGEKQRQLIMTLEGDSPGSYGSAGLGSSMTSATVAIKQNKVLIDYETIRWEDGKEVKSKERKEFQF